MAGPRLDEVRDNCFRLPGRINSTWGGNLTDMVRSTHCLRVIEQEQLVDNAGTMGRVFLSQLQQLAAEEPMITGVRGRGLILAFDLPDRADAGEVLQRAFRNGLAGDPQWRTIHSLSAGAGLSTMRETH